MGRRRLRSRCPQRCSRMPLVAVSRAPAIVTLFLLCVPLAASGQPPVVSRDGDPGVVIENCGVSTTYTEAPKRVVTMNQAATELMLALGLQDRLVGTAYLDDAILPAFSAAYQRIPVLAAQYPSREELLDARPDFVYAAYASAFGQAAAGPREELIDLGARSYVSPSGCGGRRQPESVSIATVYGELRDIGRIFGISARAEQVIATYQADIEATQARIGIVRKPPTVFWYDSGDPPSAGACCGSPNEILRLVGAENVFGETPGSWTSVTWDEVIARNPDAIVLVDASWSPALNKGTVLSLNKTYAGIEAVKQQRFVTIDFSYTTPGIRIVAAVRKLAESLYPEKFSVTQTDPYAGNLSGIR